MAGRKRRASTSSVESIDENRIPWRQEVSVVRRVPKDMSADDWPIFELRDAVVLNQDGHTLENALHVGIRGPFIVRGNLVIDDPSQRSHLIMRVRSSVPIEIKKCINYSIGESDDGSPLIWISGVGGWYEINPSRTYRPTFLKMCEATTLYYKLVDIYDSTASQRKSKKAKQSSFMDDLAGVFLTYAARVGDGCTFDEVVERCHEHAGFFICQFPQETMIDWQPTAFHRWLMMEHADLVDKIDELSKNPQATLAIPSAEALSPRRQQSAPLSLSKHADAESASKVCLTKHPSGEPSPLAPAAPERGHPNKKSRLGTQPSRVPAKALKPVEPSPDKPSARFDEALASVVKAMEFAYDLLANNRKGIMTSTLINKIYFAYSFPCYRDGTTGSHKTPVIEVLHYYSAALLQHLDASKWQKHEIWSYLQQRSKIEFNPVAYRLADFPIAIFLRKQIKRDSAPTPPKRPANQTPTVDGASTPKGKRLKHPVSGAGHGNTGALRLPSTSKKRARSQFESESESEASDVKDSHDDFLDVDNAADDIAEADHSQSSRVSSKSPQAEPASMMIRAEKIPSTLPHGPDETWTCSQAGCEYIVRGGDDEECQSRIRQHFQEHSQQLQRLSLAVTESRGHMPINHLLEKIKRLGEKAQQQHTVNGVLAPQPIKRKLISCVFCGTKTYIIHSVRPPVLKAHTSLIGLTLRSHVRQIPRPSDI
ncbi:hypothetical protein RJ55_02543 [Drechmeria coniospora]|nr:hypothetical protein RJ55_02543 [Drechmeria coniospora]